MKTPLNTTVVALLCLVLVPSIDSQAQSADNCTAAGINKGPKGTRLVLDRGVLNDADDDDDEIIIFERKSGDECPCSYVSLVSPIAWLK